MDSTKYAAKLWKIIKSLGIMKKILHFFMAAFGTKAGVHWWQMSRNLLPNLLKNNKNDIFHRNVGLPK